MTSKISPRQAHKPQPRPDTSTQARRLVGIAWPTGRAIYSYTPGELADGVDVYTRAMKAAIRAGGQEATAQHEK